MASGRLSRLVFVVALALLAPLPAQAQEPDARAIIAKAYEAQGGDDWTQVHSLVLKGWNRLYPQGLAEPATLADDYMMWREMDPDRDDAHAADGKVRIDARAQGKLLFQVAFDGTTTRTEKGVVPEEQAKALWAGNFGFGIIRQALKPGFKLARLPDDLIDGHPSFMVRVTDPNGGETLFGIDKATYAIRKAAFQTPKGWHERLYSDFLQLSTPRWLQARSVRLYYNGVKANEVYWQDVTINSSLDPAVFTLGAKASDR